MFPFYSRCIFQSNFRSFRAQFMAAFILIFCPLAGGQDPVRPDADTGGMRTGTPRPPVKGAQIQRLP